MSRWDCVDRLAQVLDSDGVVVGSDVRERPTRWGGRGDCAALAVIRPRCTDELAAAMSICHEYRQPVVVHGGVTGLAGGTTVSDTEVVVSLERMRALGDLDATAGTVCVQAGATLSAVQQLADEHDLFFPVDLGARGSCTIGGNIATNAGGNRVLRYGMMREQVLGLEVVLADGTVVSGLRALHKDNAGYDLKHLFIGSEGTLGIVSRAVLRLLPKPRSRNVAFASVRRFCDLPLLLRRLQRSLWGTLSAFEVMSREFYSLVVDGTGCVPPVDGKAPWYVLVESLGGSPELDREQFLSALGDAEAASLVVDCAVAHGPSECEAFWAIREETACLVRALRPYYAFDVSLPVAAMEGYISHIERGIVACAPGVGRVLVFGHLGDGNLHIVLSAGRGEEAVQKELEALVYAPLGDLRGSVSAEHGVGVDKLPYVGLSRTPAELTAMAALKRALDPRNRLNRGKVVPVDGTSPSPVK